MQNSAAGPGGCDRDVKRVPVSLKEGDTVLLQEHGGTEVMPAEKEYVKLVYSLSYKLGVCSLAGSFVIYFETVPT
jgi:co-chaperonin GroES (HSP10)